MVSVLSVRLASDEFEGRLFFLDSRRLTVDELMLAEVVARQFSASLQQPARHPHHAADRG
jgi:hypothetical protein